MQGRLAISLRSADLCSGVTGVVLQGNDLFVIMGIGSVYINVDAPEMHMQVGYKLG